MTNEEREEAIKELKAFKNKSWDGMSEEVIDVAIEALEQESCLDAISREKKTGRWILTMPRGAEEWSYKCSECNFWKYKKTINLSKFKYCPNCGAEMEVEE